VLVGEDKCFKLCDFGSCSSRTVDFARINKTEYSHIREEMEAVTTPLYRPPEMVDPYLQLEVSSKVDLWMVGCVLYTLAYFTHPFVDANAIGIAGAVYRFPTYPDETQYQVSEKIKDFIRNLLTPNPAYRPTTEQAIQIINNWYTSEEVPLNVRIVSRRNRRGRGRRRSVRKSRRWQC
jgi:AP2-associated kinase